MIVRSYFKCLTCDQINVFRVQIGHSNIQKHEIACIECYENLAFNLHLNQSLGDIEGFETIENCELIKRKNINNYDELPVRYLSDEILASKSEINSELSFPSGRVVHNITEMIKSGNLSNFETQSQPHVSIVDDWEILRKAWNLENNNKKDLSIEKLASLSFKDGLLDLDVESALYEFIYKFLSVSDNSLSLFENALSFTQTIARTELNELKKHYKSVKSDRMRRALDIFLQFFNNFSQFSQVKFSEYLPEDLVVTSKSFEKVKMFYGNCFEHITSNIETLACLNNIVDGRDFDQFESMNLKKYNKIDKSNKANPLKNNSSYYNLFKDIDSQLRNASHHGHIFCEEDTVKYRLNNGQDYKEISYTDYLKKCTSIFHSFCILTAIEIYLDKIAFIETKKANGLNPLAQAIKQANL